MPYVVNKDGATIPKDQGNRTSLRTGKEFRTYQTNVYSNGDLLSDDEVSQVVKDKYEEGDEKVRSLITEVSQEDYDNADQSKKSGVAARFQAEGGGDVDEPRKIQTAVTRIDRDYLDSEKGDVVDAAIAEGDEDDSSEASDEASDANEVGVEGGGDVDEPRKVQDAPTGNELDEELETNTKKSKKASVKKAGK